MRINQLENDDDMESQNTPMKLIYIRTSSHLANITEKDMSDDGPIF